jgi:cytochrome d ubiquinol oxidase subunit I
MFGFDALELARFQFAFTVSFHFIFPAFSIGLASYLAVLNGAHLFTGREVFLRLFNYWKIIFAVAFAMGVVSGIVMSYQFGTNWSVFSERAGPTVGPVMAYEVLTAFFLEAGFLGVMLFGREKVGPKLHFLATFMVGIGTIMSSFWILSVNSWMHTPQGFSINEVGEFIPENYWEVIFNPSFPYRLVHTVLAAYLTTALVVGAVGAWHLLRDRTEPAARTMFTMAMGMLVVVAPLQILAGDFQGVNTFEHQPAKVAAMEGHYDTHVGAPLILFGIPDDEAEVTRYALEIPRLGSLILTHEWDGEVKGLKEWPRDQRPPAEIVFYTFRIMVGLGFLMLGLGLWSAWAYYKGRLYDTKPLLYAAMAMGPAGFVAVIAGWVTTEVGRQPWTVYGHLTTADSVSPIGVEAVSTSLVAFILVYFAVFGAGTFYILRLMSQPPAAGSPVDKPAPIRTAGITPGPTQARAPSGGKRRRAMELDLAFISGRRHSLRRPRLRRARRLRPRHRDPLPDARRRKAPRSRDEHRRSRVGRQRDVAHHGRRGAPRRLSARLRDRHARALRPDHRDAARAHLPRRRLRVPLAHHAMEIRLGPQLLRRLRDGGLCAGRGARRAGPGDRCREPRLRGRQLGLAHVLLHPDRRRAGGGLCAPRRDWLVMKTEGYVRDRAAGFAWLAGPATLGLIGVVSLWTPFLNPEYFQRWFSTPNIFFTGLVPALVLLAAYVFWKGMRNGPDWWPFVASLAVFILSFVGLGISFYPYIVPPHLTIHETATTERGLAFVLVGASVLVPLILAYTAYSYWVFRGKIDPDHGYH